MHKHVRRSLITMSVVVAAAVTTPIAVATPDASSDATASARPAFRMPFECGQRWLGSNWQGHSPGHSIDWNHYDANGNRDDLGRRVFASAGGKVLASYYSTDTGYGNTIVIGHGDGWQTRYAHLKARDVKKGATVKVGQRIGQVGKSSAKYDITAHLHYEQMHDGDTVVSVVQGVMWGDYLKRNQTSKNRCS
ncbi:M23 family metallopeptidase [Streptomyces albidus (ex Kaewkla and Franco 2022)]|uniref:M23 family metallopeptidase n=1 Tax=Streptomyces albidus (ex Kaewkla and Franco 2022) TaxID=722709 RepID=UPI0015EF64DF|nr:M23 family metallopeptidase [Streptomyces albidus (ex Kaewkla and Franco 2022)]